MSGDIGLEQPIVFYSKEMTESKKVLLRHKGIELASVSYTHLTLPTIE